MPAGRAMLQPMPGIGLGWAAVRWQGSSRPAGCDGGASETGLLPAMGCRHKHATNRLEREDRVARAARLLALMQALRRRRRPVAARVLAEEFGVSQRTIYRDIETLVDQGAAIKGDAGLGYVLRPGFFLPPLAFDEEQTDALLLGLRLVAARGDPALHDAARDATAKLEAVLPPERDADGGGLRAGPVAASAHLPAIRAALRAEHKLALDYRDKAGRSSRRVVWPVALGFFEAAEVLAAWCELRRDFRHFRLDRIAGLTQTGERIGQRRRVLLAEWRLAQALDDGY